MDITPGSTVCVEITKTPRRESAEKTLFRVCAKDPQIAKLTRTRKSNRPSWREKIRGGRWWHHQMKSRPMAKLVPGERYHVFATLDVIRDLASVSSCVKVTAQ